MKKVYKITWTTTATKVELHTKIWEQENVRNIADAIARFQELNTKEAVNQIKKIEVIEK